MLVLAMTGTAVASTYVVDGALAYESTELNLELARSLVVDNENWDLDGVMTAEEVKKIWLLG